MADETTSSSGEANSAETTTETTTAETQNQASSDTTDQSAGTQDKVDLGGDDDAGDDADKAGDKEEGDEEDDPRAAFYGAPEGDAGYEITGLPEGTEIDTEALEAVTPVLKELNLSNEGASKLLASYAETVLPRVAQQVTSGIEAQVIEQRKAWELEAREAIQGKTELKTKTGKTIDFGGRNVDQVMKVAARALDNHAPAGFREFLKETGLAQHPAMVAFAYNAGLAAAEDTIEDGGGAGEKRKSTPTERFYGR